MSHTIELTSSYKPRPSVQGGVGKSGQYKTGACLWGKDTYHAVGKDGKTLCGVNSRDWMKLPPMNTDDAIADSDFCNRCASKLIKNGN